MQLNYTAIVTDIGYKGSRIEPIKPSMYVYTVAVVVVSLI